MTAAIIQIAVVMGSVLLLAPFGHPGLLSLLLSLFPFLLVSEEFDSLMIQS